MKASWKSWHESEGENPGGVFLLCSSIRRSKPRQCAWVPGSFGVSVATSFTDIVEAVSVSLTPLKMNRFAAPQGVLTVDRYCHYLFSLLYHKT